MPLSFSRHQYAELVFDQRVEPWLRCDRHAFESFGGVPSRAVSDNLKAGIVKAAVYDPVVQRSYRQLAERYGFLISPCRPRTPEHKGKVESGVRNVKRNFLKGNEKLGQWVDTTAGLEWGRRSGSLEVTTSGALQRRRQLAAGQDRRRDREQTG